MRILWALKLAWTLYQKLRKGGALRLWNERGERISTMGELDSHINGAA